MKKIYLILFVTFTTLALSNTSYSKTGGAAQNDTVPNAGTQLSYTSKYDFVQGDKIIAYEDFEATNLGDFPVRWNTDASAEVVTVAGMEGKWLKIGTKGVFHPEFINNLPENFRSVFDNDVEMPQLSKHDYQLVIEILKNSKKFESNLEKFKTLPSFYRKRLHPPTIIRIEILNQQYSNSIKNILVGNNEIDEVENAAYTFAQKMIYALNKMLQSSKYAFHNAYIQKSLFDKEYKRE